MHYLTILSFAKFNPDFRIIIYTTNTKSNLITWNTHEHKQQYTNLYDFNKLKDIPGVEIIYIDVNSEIDYSGELSPVWKSDIIRIKKLYDHGGFYIDFDTLFINKIPDSLINLPNDIGLNTYHGAINNAFIVSRPRGVVIKHIYDAILNILKTNSIDNTYMLFGSTLITPLIFKNKILNNLTYFIPNVMTCPYLWNEMGKLFCSNIDQTNDSTFCIHWYNGDHTSRQYCSTFTPDTEINENRCIFENKLKRVLSPI
jgi:hypothetical protein